MSPQDNVSRIKVVRKALGNLLKEVVFVGGSTVSFYADRETFEVRETDDVDVIVEVLIILIMRSLISDIINADKKYSMLLRTI